MSKACRKIREWILRYGPAEIASLAGTLIVAIMVRQLTGSALKTAAAGTLGGNVGYFGTILLQDVVATHQTLHQDGREYTWTVFLKNVRALFIEFGLAELLDTFIIRPFLLYRMPVWTGSFTWGIIIAKFAADITFYLPAILFYERSKKRYRNF